jgi:protoheme IX farnesyltransferase
MHHVKFFLSISKLRVVELVFTTMIPSTLLIAKDYQVDNFTVKIIALAFGGVIAAMGSGAVNNYLDRDIDTVMSRTCKKRPTAGNSQKSKAALYYGIVLNIVAALIYLIFLEKLGLVFLVVAVFIYTVFYSIFLKKTTWQNIVWGGIAGSLPPIIVSAALLNQVNMSSIVLSLLIFFWTPVHYWPLAYYYADDYRAAKIPMLPIVKSISFFKMQMLLYGVYLVVTSFILQFYIETKLPYLIAEHLINFIYFILIIDYILTKKSSLFLAKSIKMFHYSIYYLFLFFLVISLNVVFGFDHTQSS